VPRPKKYAYESPAKSVKKVARVDKQQRHQAKVNSGQHKKRMQLFKDDGRGGSVGDNAGLAQRLDFDDEEKTCKLEERFNKVTPMRAGGGQGQQQQQRRRGGRRVSLESAKSKTSSSLGDFVIQDSNAKQANKKARRKKAKSLSPQVVSNDVPQKKYIPGLNLEEDRKMKPVEVQPELSEDEDKGAKAPKEMKADACSLETVAQRLVFEEEKPVEIDVSKFETMDEPQSFSTPVKVSQTKQNEFTPEKGSQNELTPVRTSVAKANELTPVRGSQNESKPVKSAVVKNESTPERTSTAEGYKCKPEKEQPNPDLVQADPQLVTSQDDLDRLSLLYSFVIENNLAINVSVELFLLIELLVSHEKVNEDDVSGDKLLDSVHNCVYFAVSVFERAPNLLRFLDKITLDLLVRNARVEAFSQPLHATLVEFNSWAAGKEILLPKGNEDDAPLESVRFNPEEDNAKNFPSDKDFQVERGSIRNFTT